MYNILNFINLRYYFVIFFTTNMLKHTSPFIQRKILRYRGHYSKCEKDNVPESRLPVKLVLAQPILYAS